MTVEQGLDEMRSLVTAGIAAAALTGGAMLGFGMGGIATAQAQGLSEKSVRTLMDYAWAITPDRFTKPNGSQIVVDRKKRAEIEVPLESAREVIRVGRLSSHAQVCGLRDEQALNYKSLMLRESQKKKWSEQQMLYMNQLHLVTVMLLTGRLKLIEREEGSGKELKMVEDTKDAKDAKAKSAAQTEAKSCSDEQRAKVKQTIDTYVKAGPKIIIREAAAPPAAGGPTPQATPTSAPAAAAKK